jgi:hypothetical protein
MEATTTTTTTTDTAAALDFCERFVHGYAGEYTLSSRYGYAIVFTPGAVARFATVVGWLTGLKHAGKADLAASLATDLDAALARLASYGRREEFEVIDGTHAAVIGRVTVPRMKVVLGDDGTFGGFTIAWYSAITQGEIVKRAREAHLDAWKSEDGDGWRQALDSTREGLRLRRELDDLLYYKPDWASDENYRSSEIVSYAYAFNGGLLYHGPGRGEVYAVTIGDVRGWSVHT